LTKKERLLASGGWRLHYVQKHVELHDIYQGLSREIARRGEFFS